MCIYTYIEYIDIHTNIYMCVCVCVYIYYMENGNPFQYSFQKIQYRGHGGLQSLWSQKSDTTEQPRAHTIFHIVSRYTHTYVYTYIHMCNEIQI